MNQNMQLQIESSQPSPEQERERSEWRAEIEMVVKCLADGLSRIDSAQAHAGFEL